MKMAIQNLHLINSRNPRCSYKPPKKRQKPFHPERLWRYHLKDTLWPLSTQGHSNNANCWCSTMPNMNDTNTKWENKVLAVCNKCRQNLRLPISYKPLQVTCPKCKNEFLYNYIMEFGNEGEHYTKVQIEWVLLILGLIIIYIVCFIISIASQNFFVAIISVLAGIFIIPQLINYKVFSKYKPIKLLVINRQGIIYFDENYRAKECLNWNDIKSAKYIYSKRMFAGLIETKREPAYVELDMGEKGQVIVPPSMFFSDEQRIKIIDAILRHYGSSSFFGMYNN